MLSKKCIESKCQGPTSAQGREIMGNTENLY